MTSQLPQRGVLTSYRYAIGTVYVILIGTLLNRNVSNKIYYRSFLLKNRSDIVNHISVN